MKNTMKKMLSLLLVTVMFVTAVPVVYGSANNIQLTVDVSEYRKVWLSADPEVMYNKYFCQDENYFKSAILSVTCTDIMNNIHKSYIDMFDRKSSDLYMFYYSTPLKSIRIEGYYFDSFDRYLGLNEVGGFGALSIDVSTPHNVSKTFTEKEMRYTNNDLWIYWDGIFIGDPVYTSEMRSFEYIYNLDFSGEQLPAGYNFKEDRYSFRNSEVSDVVSEEIYKDVFGKKKGKIIYKDQEDGSSHGLCYGMAVTTGSLLLDVPAVSSFVRYVGACNNIKDINKGTKCYELNTITAKDFIKYGYVTQFSTQAETNFGDCEAIYNAVADYVFNGGVPVTISLKEFVYDRGKGEWEQSFGHRVLAVGIDGGNGIIVDDSNKGSKQTVYFSKDEFGNFTNEWSYSGYSQTTNGTNTFDESVGVARFVGYNTAIALPYMVLKANAQLDGYPDSADENEDYIADLKSTPLDEEYNLVSVSSDFYNIESEDEYLFAISGPESGEKISKNKRDLYWINNDSGITVSDLSSKENEVIIANNDIALKVNVCEESTVNFTVDNESESISADLDVVEGKEYTVTLDTNNEIDDEIDVSISGTANGTEITATQTETGLVVTGISDGTVTLSKDDEVIATQEIKDAESDIEITYDTDGSSDDLDVEYHSHSYTSTETKTATCKEKGEITYTCTCEDTYTEEIPVNPDNHIGKTEVRNSSESTCEKNGYTGDIYCLDCGEKISEGESKELLDHNYNADGICEMCEKDRTENCTHMCHKTGFMGIIWKILRFFYKLFGSNPVCQCGIKHY